jgi:hypothetical protein
MNRLPLHFSSEIDQKVLDICKLPQYQQRTEEWYAARETCITASDIASALVQSEQSCGYYIDSFKNLENFEFKLEHGKLCNKYSKQLGRTI